MFHKPHKFSPTYGEGNGNNYTCQKRFEKLCEGNFLLTNAPQLGSSVEVDSDRIKTLLENTHRYAMPLEKGHIHNISREKLKNIFTSLISSGYVFLTSAKKIKCIRSYLNVHFQINITDDEKRITYNIVEHKRSG